MRTLIVVLFALLTINGCGGGATQADLAGSWTGTVDMPMKVMQQDVMANREQSAFLSAQESQGKKLALELREDGTLTFTAFEPLEGTWTLDGSKVVMTLPARPDKTEASFTGTYKLELKGDEISGPDPNVEGVTVIFSR